MDKTNMSAVILAGGFGTRLAPLTDSVPKPLMRVLDKTVLSVNVEKLINLGIRDITISSFYMWEQIREHMKKYEQVKVVHEAVPMGTAGATKLCANENSHNVLVLSGDGVFDFDLERICASHIKNNADVTIVTTFSKNPTRFGVIVDDEKGNVIRLVEKPAWRKVVTNVVNTGIYVLSKKALEKIPNGLFYDFSKDLFPKLLKNGFKVMTVTLEDYWCDIGSHEEYLKCNLDAGFGKIKTLPNNSNARENLLSVGIDVRDDVYLGENVSIGCNVVLEKGFVCGNDCDVKSECRVSASVLGDGVKLGKGCGVYGSIIGDGVTVEDNCIIPEGCVIESGSIIEEGTVLDKNTCVNKNGCKTNKGCINKQQILFTENSVVYLSGQELYKKAYRYARAFAKAVKEEICPNPTVALVCNIEEEKIKTAVVKGFNAQGMKVMEFCDAKDYHAAFIDIYFPCDVTVYVEQISDGVRIKMLSAGAGCIDDEIERKTTKYMSFDLPDGKDECDNYRQINGVEQIYELVLKTAVEKMLGNTRCICKNIGFYAACEKGKCLEKVMGDFCINDEKYSVEKTMVTFGENGYVIKGEKAQADENHTLASVLDNFESLGLEKAYIDEESPDILSYILRKNGTAFGYIEHDGRMDMMKNTLEMLVCRDMNFCVAALLCIMSVKGKSFSTIMKELVEFEIFTDELIGCSDRAASMGKLCKLYGIGDRKGDGVTVRLADGNVTVIPDRVRGFKIISEAVNMETAKELCGRISKIVTENDK